MNATAVDARFVQVPAELLSSVRRALARDREPLESVTLLREVGFELGEAVHGALCDAVSAAHGGADPQSLEPDAFWEAASGYFTDLGWGRVEHRRLHPGVGAVDLLGWIENGADGGPPGCHVSTGIFTDLLGRLAGGPVVVMEVPVGEGRTRLLFGGQETIGRVYEAIAGGASHEEAVARLG